MKMKIIGNFSSELYKKFLVFLLFFRKQVYQLQMATLRVVMMEVER